MRYRVKVEFTSPGAWHPKTMLLREFVMCLQTVRTDDSPVDVVSCVAVPEPLSADQFVERVRERLPAHLVAGSLYADLVTDLRNLLTEHDRGRGM